LQGEEGGGNWRFRQGREALARVTQAQGLVHGRFSDRTGEGDGQKEEQEEEEDHTRIT
jgi:IS5 family transposase